MNKDELFELSVVIFWSITIIASISLVLYLFFLKKRKYSLLSIFKFILIRFIGWSFLLYLILLLDIFFHMGGIIFVFSFFFILAPGGIIYLVMALKKNFFTKND